MSIRVRPGDTMEGDRIVGMSCVITGPGKWVGYIYADAVGQQRWDVPVTWPNQHRPDGFIPYMDDSWVYVIREELG